MICDFDNLEIKKFGSQGQNKTFQIALRFSQFFYLKDKLKITPLFLMDDVFGELDSFRAEKISNYLSEIGQAFITMTDFSKLEKLSKSDTDLVFNVNDGNFRCPNSQQGYTGFSTWTRGLAWAIARGIWWLVARRPNRLAQIAHRIPEWLQPEPHPQVHLRGHHQ